jgi:putative membrane protein
MKLLIRVVINAIALWLTDVILSQITIQEGIINLLIVAVIFGLVNAFIGPLVKILSLPITIITLGLFALVINALLLMLTSLLAGDLMTIDGNFLTQVWWALIGSVIISIVSTILSKLLPD